MYSIRYIVILLFIFSAASAQSRLDSLYAVWEKPNLPDSTRAMALADYIYEGPFANRPDSAIVLAKTLYEFTKKRITRSGPWMH